MRYDALFFGRLDVDGHFLYDIHGAVVRPSQLLPESLRCLDGTLLPDGPQREGLAQLVHGDGWTVLAFWDRSADPRPNSNSAFLLRGRHDFPTAVSLARHAFPAIWRRFDFPVVLAVSPSRSEAQ